MEQGCSDEPSAAWAHWPLLHTCSLISVEDLTDGNAARKRRQPRSLLLQTGQASWSESCRAPPPPPPPAFTLRPARHIWSCWSGSGRLAGGGQATLRSTGYQLETNPLISQGRNIKDLPGNVFCSRIVCAAETNAMKARS